MTYRKQGEQAWKAGLPLLRIGNERINENALQYVTPNGFAGSVFDLDPATEYEARFVLSDPDGVDGQSGTHRRRFARASSRCQRPAARSITSTLRISGPAAAAGFHRPARGVLHRRIALRQLQHVSASCAARRHDSRSCRSLQGRSLSAMAAASARCRAARTS